jgi:hypothetical protein
MEAGTCRADQQSEIRREQRDGTSPGPGGCAQGDFQVVTAWKSRLFRLTRNLTIKCGIISCVWWLWYGARDRLVWRRCLERANGLGRIGDPDRSGMPVRGTRWKPPVTMRRSISGNGLDAVTSYEGLQAATSTRVKALTSTTVKARTNQQVQVLTKLSG